MHEPYMETYPRVWQHQRLDNSTVYCSHVYCHVFGQTIIIHVMALLLSIYQPASSTRTVCYRWQSYCVLHTLVSSDKAA